MGLLALFAGAAFFGLLGFVLQGVLGNDRVNYFILFEENVKGMVIGSKVNFQGVPIGMVEDIRFKDGKTLVVLSVEPNRADIQDLTRARLDRLLVTGQVTVELEGYGPEGRSLRPGMYIEPKADPINQLTKTLPELVPQINDILERLETLLDGGNAVLDEPNRAHIAALLANTDAASARLPGLVDRLEATLGRADGALAALAGTAGDVRALLPKGERLVDQMFAAAAETSSLLATLRAPAQAALTSLRTSLDDLRGFARQMRLAPDSLIFGVSRPAAPDGGGR